MHLTPREFDKLIIHMMAEVAHKRQAKGLKLNHPEAVAVLCAYVLEQAREGKTVEEVMDGARSVLKSDDVMDGVPDLLPLIQVEAVFTRRQPAGQPAQPDHLKAAGKHRLNGQRGRDSMAKARKVAGDERSRPLHPQPGHENMPHKAVRPIGGYVLRDEPDRDQRGRPRTTLKVRNTGDRPIQVGSHFHFFEVNRALEFDRRAAFGLRLDIPAGTAVRFEPGDEKEVTLVPFGGKQLRLRLQQPRRRLDRRRAAPGLPPQPRRRRRAAQEAGLQVRHATSRQRSGKPAAKHRPHGARLRMTQISRTPVRRPLSARPPATRSASATPTSTSRSRRTCGSTATSCMYGGGKTLRDGMGSDNQLTSEAGCLDLVITNVTIIDPILGVVKADVGVKDGKIVGIGKAGNPGTMDGVTPGLATGTATDAISGEHLILTAAGMDPHVHYICAAAGLRGAQQRHHHPLGRRHRARPTAPTATTITPAPGTSR